ncbi:hypothetical protein GCM10012283_14790 [Phycicoccus endophyticus]|nr:hypothetical protein GCM10012283_14790 [Phycicoccus endophyticus]
MASVLCSVLAALLTGPAVAAAAVHQVATDGDAYVRLVGPLAEDPAVQDAAVRHLVDAVDDRLVDDAPLDLAADALESRGVPPALARALQLPADPARDAVLDRVRATSDAVVSSPAFARSWTTANAAAHERAIGLLRGETTPPTTDDGTVGVSLDPLLDTVLADLAHAGVPGVTSLSPPPVVIPVVRADRLEQWQRSYRLLTAGTTALALAPGALFLLGVSLARDRRRAVRRSAAGAVVSVLVLLVVVALVRERILDEVAAPDRAAVGAVVTAVTGPVRGALRWTAVALLVVVGATAVDRARTDAVGALVRAARRHPATPVLGIALALGCLLATTWAGSSLASTIALSAGAALGVSLTVSASRRRPGSSEEVRPTGLGDRVPP